MPNTPCARLTFARCGKHGQSRGRADMKPKLLLGGSLITAAVIVLIVTSMASTMQYFLTVTQLHDRSPSMIDRSARVSGAVIFESTLYEMRNGEPHLEFDIVD